MARGLIFLPDAGVLACDAPSTPPQAANAKRRGLSSSAMGVVGGSDATDNNDDEEAGEYVNTSRLCERPAGGCLLHSSRKYKHQSIGFAIETSGAWGPAAKRLVWSIAEAGGGPQDVVA